MACDCQDTPPRKAETPSGNPRIAELKEEIALLITLIDLYEKLKKTKGLTPPNHPYTPERDIVFGPPRTTIWRARGPAPFCYFGSSPSATKEKY